MATLRDVVRTEIKTPVDIETAVRLCGPGNFKGILYDDLSSWTEARLARYDGVMILFTKHGGGGGAVGHFCCLYKLGGVWQLFDPLAVGLDQILHIMHSEPHLTRILAGHKVEQNHRRFQKFADNVQDCALHCATRLKMRRMSHTAYSQWLKYKRLSGDELVSLLHAMSYHL